MKKIILVIGFLAILANIIAYNHAYQFTHFTNTSGKRLKPEDLSLFQKAKVLFTGVSNPKPKNETLPQSPYEVIKIESHEPLEGWLIEAEKPKGVVILFHGYSGSKSGILNYGLAFNQFGYTTLLMDFMGSGGSGGLKTTIGYQESRDVKESYEFIKEKYPNQKIILFGSSMGAVSIMKALNDYEMTPDKIILECPFGSFKLTVEKRFEAMKVPSFPFAHLLLFYGGLQNGFNAFKHNPTEYAKRIDAPTLLIYGAKDKRVTIGEIQTIFEHLGGAKELMVLEQSGHENYLVNSQKVWKKKVQSFMEQAF